MKKNKNKELDKNINKKVSNKKSIEKLLIIMIIFLAISNVLLSYVLNKVRIEHDAISNFSPEHMEAKIKNYNLKKELKDLKKEQDYKLKLKDEKNK